MLANRHSACIRCVLESTMNSDQGYMELMLMTINTFKHEIFRELSLKVSMQLFFKEMIDQCTM